jgi:hypothetical protein
LPHEVFFYLRTRAANLRFPFPRSIDERRVLHIARAVEEPLLRATDPPEDTEPQALIALSSETVLGMQAEADASALEAVYVSVPSGYSEKLGVFINPTIEPTELLVNVAESGLARALSRKGGAGRIVVPIKPRFLSRREKNAMGLP